VPVVGRVDTGIFVQRYFMRCMECSYCFDSCCQYGWFSEGWEEDSEFPGGRYTRTRLENGACVFRSRHGRGCVIHSFALERGIDYHELKPMVSALFPVTFDDGLLHSSTEVVDRSLQCIDDGPTVYRGIREEIAWYFGPALIEELDALEHGTLAKRAVAK
jgi:hypothetical protein